MIELGVEGLPADVADVVYADGLDAERAGRVAGQPVPVGGEVGQVGPAPAQERRVRHVPEPGQPVEDVGGVAGLARLTVVDHVEAGRLLRADDLGDGPAHVRTGRAGRQPGRPGQAAGVRGQDPLGAGLHRDLPSLDAETQSAARAGGRQAPHRLSHYVAARVQAGKFQDPPNRRAGAADHCPPAVRKEPARPVLGAQSSPERYGTSSGKAPSVMRRATRRADPLSS